MFFPVRKKDYSCYDHHKKGLTISTSRFTVYGSVLYAYNVSRLILYYDLPTLRTLYSAWKGIIHPWLIFSNDAQQYTDTYLSYNHKRQATHYNFFEVSQ